MLHHVALACDQRQHHFGCRSLAPPVRDHHHLVTQGDEIRPRGEFVRVGLVIRRIDTRQHQSSHHGQRKLDLKASLRLGDAADLQVRRLHVQCDFADVGRRDLVLIAQRLQGFDARMRQETRGMVFEHRPGHVETARRVGLCGHAVETTGLGLCETLFIAQDVGLCGEATCGQARSEQARFGGVPSVQRLAVRAEGTFEACGLCTSNTKCHRHGCGIQSEQAAGRRCGSKSADGRCRVKPTRVVVVATQCADPAFSLEARNEGGQHVLARRVQVCSQSQCHRRDGHAGVSAHGLVHVVIVQGVRHRTIHQDRGRKGQALPATDDGRGARQAGIHALLQKDAHERLIAARDRHTQPIQQALLGDGQGSR